MFFINQQKQKNSYGDNMNVETIKEIEELSRLLVSDELKSINDDRIFKLEEQINQLQNKTSNMDNYKQDSDTSDLEIILKPIDNELAELDNSINDLEASKNKVQAKINKNKSKTKVYYDYIDALNTRNASIDKVINFRPDLKDALISEQDNINNQIHSINKVLEPYIKEKERLYAELNEYQSKQDSLLTQKQSLLKQQDDYKRNYISSLQALSNDQQKLSKLLEDKLKNNIYDQLKNLLEQYKNRLIPDERFKELLSSLKDDINNDIELKNQNQRFFNNLISKINSIENQVENKIVKENTLQYEEPILEDDFDDIEEKTSENEQEPEEHEVVEKREAPEKLKDKIKKNFKRIVAGALAVLSISSFGFGLSNYKRKNNNINYNPSNIVYNVDDDINDLSNNFDDIIEAQKNIAFKTFQTNENTDVNSIPTSININNNARIYDDSYSAVRKENPEKPYYGYDMNRSVFGVTFKMPDGSLRTLYKDNKNFNDEYKELYNQGGSIEAYLTGNENGYEGFWNVNDVSTGKKR